MATRKIFDVDISSIINATNFLDRVPAELAPRLAFELEELAKEILFEVFYAAMPLANSQGGFPAPFQEHVLSRLREMPIFVGVAGTVITIVVDFGWLGDSDDLERAYHQGALLDDFESGSGRDGRLWGPYVGQGLKSEDALTRFSAWNAVYAGYGGFKFGRKSRTYWLPDWASWEETMEQRIRIWGDKAPEWLYIEVGQQEYPPYIPPGAPFEDFQARFHIESRALFERELARYVAISNSYSARGIEVVPVTQRAGNVRIVRTGRFASARNY